MLTDSEYCVEALGGKLNQGLGEELGLAKRRRRSTGRKLEGSVETRVYRPLYIAKVSAQSVGKCQYIVREPPRNYAESESVLRGVLARARPTQTPCQTAWWYK